MKLVSLVENTSISTDLYMRHGLSLYVETSSHRIVFDFGPDETLLHNAAALHIDLTAADVAFLSHGHYDHGGGLEAFLSVNRHAPIYLNKNAFNSYWSSETRYIGLDQALKTNPQLCFTDGITKLYDGMTLISRAPGRRFLAASNSNLEWELPDGTRVRDNFLHEQSLIIEDGDICLLLAGCAHSGIVNIMEQAKKTVGRPMTHVVAGFHLYQPTCGISEPEENVRAIAAELKRSNTMYYTCHCTGMPSYEILREELGDRITYLSAGMQLDL